MLSTFAKQLHSETISSKGLFCSLYADRASHYWHTPEAGGKVDKDNPTQVGRARANGILQRQPFNFQHYSQFRYTGEAVRASETPVPKPAPAPVAPPGASYRPGGPPSSG